MDAFADLTYYKTTYGGASIPDANFPAIALNASHFINAITFGRAQSTIAADTDQETIDLIKMATCAVADQFHSANQETGGALIKSEQIGNYSVTYALPGDEAALLGARAMKTAGQYLGNTALMYRGLE